MWAGGESGGGGVRGCLGWGDGDGGTGWGMDVQAGGGYLVDIFLVRWCGCVRWCCGVGV